MEEFTQPFDNDEMTYNMEEHRYVLKEEYVRSRGIDLYLSLNTDFSPEPSSVPGIFLDRVSQLVYENIYDYGREAYNKEYLLACDPSLRSVIRDAMMERVRYIESSGDLSTKAGAIISQGTRVETQDLVPSPQEIKILRNAGILHRGRYYFIQDKSIVY